MLFVKKLNVFVITLTIIALLQSCNNQSTNKQNDLNGSKISVNQNEWIYLFDGASTDGWRGFQTESVPEGWIVENGNLIALGKGGDLGGDLISVDLYEDFELYLEWAISEGGNSGVFFRVIEEGYPTVYATGPEYQLIDDVGFQQPLEEWQKTGANYALHNTTSKKLKPVGEFNTSRIIVDDNMVKHWLNGEKLVEYNLWSEEWKNLVAGSKWKDYPAYGLARKGHIGLQDHGSLVQFREVKIRDLTNKGTSLFNGQDLEGWKIHGTEKWFVNNNELVCESGPDMEYGYLATVREYKDFVLHLEFKQESNGNSGVFFRSHLDGTRITGWQVEVAPEGQDSGGIYESYGRGWLYQIPEEKESILKEGEWNEMVIKVKGNRVLTWLNNEMMTDLTDEKIGDATGVVALQIHDGGGVKVKWRNIFIKEL